MKKWLLLVVTLVVVAIGYWYIASRPAVVTLTIYFGDENAEFLEPEVRSVSLVPRESLLVAAINELIKGPTEPNHALTIPPGTRLLGVEVRDGVAWTDFSTEIRTKHWGGSAGELLTTFSVVNTLTEFPEVKAVQFLVEGEIYDSIWGHGITNEPISRQMDLIGPDFR